MTITQRQRDKWRAGYDSVLGHAPGTVLSDEVQEYRVTRAAEEVLLHRYKELGYDGVHNLMGLVDDCRLPDFFEGPEYQERFLSVKIMEEQLTELARGHLGGSDDYRVIAFNRVTAGVTTLMLALVPPGSMVPYVIPPYPGLDVHGHPCVPRAVDLAKASCQLISTPQELTAILDQRSDVPLVAICGSYRGIIRDEVMVEVCDIAHAKGIPVFVDDAAGARNRVVSFGQSKATDLGADMVFTSCEKAGLYGPRAGILMGREDLLLRVGAKTVMMGTDARPSVVASMIRALEEYDPDRAEEMFDGWTARHARIWEMITLTMGEALDYGAYSGVYMGLEAFAELVLRKAGLEEVDLALADISTLHSMLMLRRQGFMTIASLHYPGATKLMSVKVNSLNSPDLTDEDIAQGVLDSLGETARIIADRSAVEQALFGPPG